MRIILTGLFIMLVTQALATDKSFVCNSEIVIGWEKDSTRDDLGRLAIQNQWLLQPISKTVSFTHRIEEPLEATYVLRVLGDDEPNAYCDHLMDDEFLDMMICFELSNSEGNVGKIFPFTYFQIQEYRSELRYNLIDDGEFFAGNFYEATRSVRNVVGYEQGHCKAF